MTDILNSQLLIYLDIFLSSPSSSFKKWVLNQYEQSDQKPSHRKHHQFDQLASSSIKKGFLMIQSKTLISRFQVLTDRINYENIINLSFSMLALPIYLTNFIIYIICLQFPCFHPNFSQIS
jgi:hypothetical protein